MNPRWLALAALVAALATEPVRAAPPPDPNAIVTLQIENDALNNTDRYYTSGLRLGYTSPTTTMPGALARIGRALWGDGTQRFAIGLEQLLFTPSDTQISPPDPNDRPYAGLLMANFALIHDTDRARSIVGLDLGVIGPAALGEEVQDGFHSLIGQHGNKGWGFQLPNQPTFDLNVGRIWRLPLFTAGSLETDVLPQAGAMAGTWRVSAMAGVQIRIGQGLNSDFGAPRIRPGMDGTDAYTATRPVAWYIFAGADGQAVGWDETLNGEPFAGTRHVSPLPLVGELEAGIAVLAYGLRFSFTHVVQTPAFRHQSGGLFQFNSAAVSLKF